MTALFWLLDTVLGFYIFVILISVILSWLIQFGIINGYQPLVRTILNFTFALTEPVLSRIRRFLPAMSGIDISPLILWFAIFALRILLKYDVAPLFGIHVG